MAVKIVYIFFFQNFFHHCHFCFDGKLLKQVSVKCYKILFAIQSFFNEIMVGEFKYLEAIKNNNVLFRVRQVKYGFNLNLN